jgi:acyl-CoA reductase-like NAD-dependent aldehyde dehydrogenase
MESTRLEVSKTWKLFIGGQFLRSESGRTAAIADARGRLLAHVARASHKDLRDAVAAARRAQGSWSRRTAFNRGQVLYRMAEILEARTPEFAALIGATAAGGPKRAAREVAAAVDRLVGFAGWADKFQQVLGTHNPVAGPYYNFTVPEAVGVVGVIAPAEEPLLALISLLAPPLCAGNAIVALGSEDHPLASALLGEVCATSDVPHGVVNLLTGRRADLLCEFASHREVDAIHAAGCTKTERRTLEAGAAENLKRVTVRATAGAAWYTDRVCDGPDQLEPFVELKTIWHPSSA